MFKTKVSWNESQIVVVVGAVSPIIIRMKNDEAVDLYDQLSLRAGSNELYKEDGSFTVGGRVYRLRSGQWASIFRGMHDWYSEYFAANLADELLDGTHEDSNP